MAENYEISSRFHLATDIAVIINQNARKVTRRVVERISNFVPKAQLYCTRTLEEANRCIREIVDKRYSKVFCAGGDGTFSNLVTNIRHYIDQKNRELEKRAIAFGERISAYSFPHICILPFGTGNSLAGIVKTPKGPKPFEEVISDKSYKTRRVHLISAEDRLFNFSGLGWDAAVLNDFIAFKEQVKNPILKQLSQGLIGYLGAILTKSIPTLFPKQGKINVRISTDDEVYFLTEYKSFIPYTPFADGTIYEGPCNMLGVATIPYYGFKLKAYPYAFAKDGFMNLRVVKAKVGEILLHTPAVWQGIYRGKNIFDFLVKRVNVEFSEEMPFQMGGDACGYRDKVEFQVSDQQVFVIDFSHYKS